MSSEMTRSRWFDRNLLKHGELYDRTLLLVLLCILAFGLIMVYSAAPEKMFMQSAVAVGSLGLAVVLGTAMPLYRLRSMYVWILGITFILLILTPFFGKTANGATRWISIGPVNIQSSEMFKLAVIIYLSSFFQNRKKGGELENVGKMLYCGLPLGIGIAMIAPTRDLGSIVVILSIAGCMLFIVNLAWKYVFLLICTMLLGGAAWVLLGSSFRLERIQAFLNFADGDMYGKNYQGIKALTAVHRGDWLGIGLGRGEMKNGYIPEHHTDFILSVVGEELGFVAIVILVAAYLWVVWRAFSISKQARDLSLLFNSFLAVGIGSWLALHVIVNVGVVLGVLPNKGLTLPLVSYGGSSLALSIISFMLLLRVDYENRRKMRGFNVEDQKKQNGN